MVSAFSGSLWRDLCIFRWTTGKCRENHRSPITDHRSPITTFFVIYFCVGVVPFFSIILVSAFSGGLPENAEIPPQTTGKCKDPATGPGLESICAARSVLCRSFAATQTSRGLELSIVPVKPHERGDGTRRRQSNSVNVSCWDALSRRAVATRCRSGGGSLEDRRAACSVGATGIFAFAEADRAVWPPAVRLPLQPRPQGAKRGARTAPLMWASERRRRVDECQSGCGGIGDVLYAPSVSMASVEASCSNGTPESATVSSFLRRVPLRRSRSTGRQSVPDASAAESAAEGCCAFRACSAWSGVVFTG